MAKYKGIEVKERVRQLLPHMPLIEEYREMLQSLQAVWDNLNLLGQMSGTTAEIGQTREAFADLTGELLNNLAEQTLAKREQDMKARSQVVVDILVRNLFERTADIGFLSTDAAIRHFAAAPEAPWMLQQRFREYVRKYSVYDDIVLLDRQGRVLARLIDSPQQADLIVQDPWVRTALSTSGAYVEAYGHSDLFPARKNSLIYAYRVTSARGDALGVLALCFRFDDEMQRIFQALASADDVGVLALIDSQNRIIASSDPWQIPVDAHLPMTSGSMQRLRFAGRNYLAFASDTQGYQGYGGPGWRGVSLVPVDQAFLLHNDEASLAAPSSLLASVMQGGQAFSEALRAIPLKAEAIQRDLSRAVWNGTVRQSRGTAAMNSAFSKILLREISRVGMNMREVFAGAIGNLNATVLSSQLADSRFLAALATDIMDRNLYERANDCRWWALDGTLRGQLSKGNNRGGTEAVEKLIRYINSLYTVYSNILVFDANGMVIAVSNPEYDGLAGQTLGETWVAECLSLRDSQSYAVSQFVPSALYAGQSTYTYLAPIFSDDERGVAGGIAIVFDSTPQFAAILDDALPRTANGKAVAGSFALFVDEAGKVIAASTHAAASFPAGSTLPASLQVSIPATESSAKLLVLDGQVMAVGISPSLGYREFKGADDDYRNPVTALICTPLGPYDAHARLSDAESSLSTRASAITDSAIREIATFHLGSHWLGLPVEAVVEAIDLVGATRLANAPKQIFGAMIHQNATLPIYNLHAALGLPVPDGVTHRQQVVVIRGEDGAQFGFLVDRLGEILEVPIADIDDLSNIYVGIASVLASVVKSSQGSGYPMLVVLSVASMSAQLRADDVSRALDCNEAQPLD